MRHQHAFWWHCIDSKDITQNSGNQKQKFLRYRYNILQKKLGNAEKTCASVASTAWIA